MTSSCYKSVYTYQVPTHRFVYRTEILIYAITLIISVIPESLPMMLTLTMVSSLVPQHSFACNLHYDYYSLVVSLSVFFVYMYVLRYIIL